MRGFIIFIWLLLYPLHLFGQLYAESNYYSRSALAINPAYAGSNNALNITGKYRNSWIGFEGAPKTLSLAIHTPIANERVGIGLFIMNDQIGIENETSVIGNYAYRMNLKHGTLAMGLGMSMIVQTTSWNNLQVHDEGDSELTNQLSTGFMPDFSLGVYYNTDRYFMGFSIPLLLSHEYNTQTNKYTVTHKFNTYNYLVTTGYRFELGENIAYYPSLLIKYNNTYENQVDFDSQFILKNRFWVGATYRSINIGSGMVQFQVNNQFRIAYSYDFVIGNQVLNKHNAHEVMLTYLFQYNVDVVGPGNY